ncbi:MAG: Hsp20 family protein [Deltaproteobacteria bacterium]|nr:Hsp20 family protein [Deltaproteobacteria bacterium]
MSVDSVNNSRADAAYQARRRALEEDRAEELDGIEKRYRDQVKASREARTEEARNVRSREAEETEDLRARSERKLAGIREATSEKVKSFEEDSAKLAEEAGRGLQRKAAELSRYGKELEQQRDRLEKSHDQSARRLSQDESEKYRTKAQELSAETQQLAEEQNRKAQELRDRGQKETAYIREEAARAKSREIQDRDKDLRLLKAERDSATVTYHDAVEHERRSGQDKLEHLRIQQELARDKILADFEDGVNTINIVNRGAVQKEMLRGQRQVAQTRDFYDEQTRAAGRGAEKSINDAHTMAKSRLDAIETDFKQQEHITSQAALNKKRSIEASTQKTIQDAVAGNAALRQKFEADRARQAELLKENHERQLSAQAKAIQGELDSQMARGQKQINEAAMASAVKASEHASRSSDPFYRLRDLGAEVEDNGAEFVLKIKVPEHEQDRIRVTGQTGMLNLTGTRRAETRAVAEDGRKVTTNAFQSFSETIPVQGKPDLAKLTRAYSDGRLTVRIPKV